MREGWLDGSAVHSWCGTQTRSISVAHACTSLPHRHRQIGRPSNQAPSAHFQGMAATCWKWPRG